MRTTLTFLLILLFSAAFAQNETKLNDTIYRNISDVQADSLIQANTGNPDFIIIDVRTVGECVSTGIIENSINIDFYGPDFDSIIQTLDHSKRYLIYCAGGSRSGQTFTKMQNWHFKEVYNMLLGISHWITDGFPVVPCCTGIDGSSPDAFMPLVYPNPVSSRFTISLPDGSIADLSLADMTGRQVLYRSQICGNVNIDISGRDGGIYILRLITGTGSYTGKIVKQ